MEKTSDKVDGKTKNKIIGKVVEIAIIQVMSNHYYKFNSKMFHQKEGGSIGLRITSLIARISMDRWKPNVMMISQMIPT